MSLLELSYISPISNYNFNTPKSTYRLVIYSKISNNINSNTNLTWIIPINNINNISKQIRAFPIAKMINIPNITGIKDQPWDIKLFKFNSANNRLTLLFTGNINLKKSGEYNILMHSPHPIMNNLISIIVENGLTVSDYYLEPFHDVKINLNNRCLVMAQITNIPSSPIVKPIMFSDQNAKSVYLVNRYGTTNVIEYASYGDNIGKGIHKIYEHSIGLNSKMNVMYKNIPYDKFILDNMISNTERPHYYENNKNNTLTVPVDGRVMMFQNKHNLNIIKKFIISSSEMSQMLSNNHDQNANIIRGSGFISRITPRDKKELYMPYDGYITEIVNGLNFISFKIVNTYFMPPSVLERDVMSVAQGQCIRGADGCDERLEQQPQIKFVMYMIITSNNNQKLNIINPKFSKIIFPNQIKDKNGLKKYKTKIWLYKGDLIGHLNNQVSFVTCLTNRSIDFSDGFGIEYDRYKTSYIKPLTKENVSPKSINVTNIGECEHYIKARDLVGYIQ